MRRHLAAVVVALGALFGTGTGAALADTPTQAALQAAGTSQSASSSATSTQVKPSNSAISVRIGSPGDNGSVSQSNDSLAGAAAGNLASTTQDASQQGSSGGAQVAGQLAKTEQSADADATSKQVHPSNSAISVRIGSPGDDGSVQQSNSSAALAKAGNAAKTTQTATQEASGSSCDKCDGGKDQAVEQAAKTKQSADADATSKQIKPSNSAISVRIHSPGDNGSVDQSNSSTALAKAGNAAKTTQTATQDPKDGSKDGSKDGHGGSIQAAGQFAFTGQSADADAKSEQVKPSNSATSVRIASPGDDGDVTQSNSSTAGAFAGNLALTDQTADQEAGSGSGNGVQALDQEAATLQAASSDATSKQFHPSNDATSVRIASPGDGGSVDQSNDSAAFSFAGNFARTNQDATQTQSPSRGCCGGDRVQAIGQFAFTGQWADSDATSEQYGASNSATSVRLPGAKKHDSCGCDGHDPSYGKDDSDGKDDPYGKDDSHGKDGSHGDDGSVSQSNASLALSAAANKAATWQSADQEQGSRKDGSGKDGKDDYGKDGKDGYGKDGKDGYGKDGEDGYGHGMDGYTSPKGDCGCSSGAGVQAVGQFAKTGQSADADAHSAQYWPSNKAGSLRIGSSGSNGSVEQSNLSLAKALAFNLAFTNQAVAQSQ